MTGKMYQSFSVSIRGASHIRKGTPCEDFGLSTGIPNGQIFALADGHGALECFRSQVGSKLICETSQKALQMFTLNIEENNWQEELLSNPKKQEKHIRQLITSIFSTWLSEVNKHYTQNPITEDEKKLAGNKLIKYLNGDNIEHIYGTTLIAGLMTKDYLLLLQQGDGHCDVFDFKGNVFQPIPWDDRCFSNVTTSVCDSDAIESCRYSLIDLRKQPVLACIAGSDGVEDSYSSMEKVHGFYRKIIVYIKEKGIDSLKEYLTENLHLLSENGSGDDITICGIVNADLSDFDCSDLSKENEITALREKISNLTDKMESMERKLSYLSECYKKAEKEYTEYNNQYLQKKQEKELAEKRLSELTKNKSSDNN